jgi:hypothetical protein
MLECLASIAVSSMIVLMGSTVLTSFMTVSAAALFNRDRHVFRGPAADQPDRVGCTASPKTIASSTSIPFIRGLVVFD